MSLWIRSQDKRFLIECNDVAILKTTDGFKIGTCSIKSVKREIDLGKYSTKEKALKVLDMIQECIEYNNSSHNSQWDSTPYRVYNVFQMPQDIDEVEE